MELSVQRQRMCAVYEADKVTENEQCVLLKLECTKDECSVIAEVCIDGITKVTGGACAVLNQGGAFNGNFIEPPTENI